jgi:hypothetical protein
VERLAIGLTTLARSQVTEEALNGYSLRVRSYLSRQEDLLRMQQEMVGSCLVRHYDEQREQILTAADKYDITNI